MWDYPLSNTPMHVEHPQDETQRRLIHGKWEHEGRSVGKEKGQLALIPCKQSSTTA